MNKLKLLIGLLFLSSTAMAQFSAMHNSNNEIITENRYSKVEGSPYLFDDWQKGTIYSSDGQILPYDEINFNGQNGKVEVREADKKIIALNALLYNKVEVLVESEKYVFANRLQSPTDLTYYHVIYAGTKLSFLKKFESDIKEEDVANYGVSKSKNRFVSSTKHYILQDNNLTFTPRSKGKILKFLNSTKLEKHIKKEKLNLKDDADLQKALSYYESL